MVLRCSVPSSKVLVILVLVLLVPIVAFGQASVTGQWAPVVTWPTNSAGWVPTHVMLLPTGKVLYVSSYTDGNKPKIWDPATGALTSAALPGYNLFCMGHTLLASGSVFMAGGHIADFVGFNHSTVYNPFTNTFTRRSDMNAGRWYPTNTTLSNGDVLVISGTKTSSSDYNNTPQVYQAATGTFRTLTSAVLRVQLYPMMFLAPNGKVFMAGWQPDTRYLDTTGTGKWTLVANSKFGWRNYGSAVMYQPGKILLIGGAGNTVGGAIPTNTVEKIDLNAATPAWLFVAPMAFHRRQHNATLLPDGKVLVTGGSSGAGFDVWQNPVYAAELYDPVANTWTTLASAANYRGYHSFSLLLPDGRVLTGGGQMNAAGQANGANIQIFSPPYLFQGARPTISSSPASVAYGSTNFVGTPDSANITSVSWIRLGAVTHSFDQNQRFQNLAFTKVTGGLNIVFPGSSKTSPPGHYLLFILKSGVPSVGKIIHIG